MSWDGYFVIAPLFTGADVVGDRKLVWSLKRRGRFLKHPPANPELCSSIKGGGHIREILIGTQFKSQKEKLSK